MDLREVACAFVMTCPVSVLRTLLLCVVGALRK